MARLFWVLGLAVLATAVFYGMRRGWVNRARRQRAWLPAFPALPSELGAELLPAAEGLYVGTTVAGDWQDRVAVGDIGHRARVVAELHGNGVFLTRTGASPLWIPAESIRDARVDRKLANKVVPALLVVTWQLGGQELDTGFRIDGGEHGGEHEAWVAAVRALAGHERTGNEV